MSRRADERKIPFNCYLTLSQLEELDTFSEQIGKPKAELVREAIAEYLIRKAHPKEQLQLPIKS